MQVKAREAELPNRKREIRGVISFFNFFLREQETTRVIMGLVSMNARGIDKGANTTENIFKTGSKIAGHGQRNVNRKMSNLRRCRRKSPKKVVNDNVTKGTRG